MEVKDRMKESGDNDVAFNRKGDMAQVPIRQPFISAEHGGLPTHFPVLNQSVRLWLVSPEVLPSGAWQLVA